MEFVADYGAFSRAVTRVAPVAHERASLQVLQCIQVIAPENGVQVLLVAGSAYGTVATGVEATITTPGSAFVPVEKFNVHKMPNPGDTLHVLSKTEGKLLIKSGRSQLTVPVLTSDYTHNFRVEMSPWFVVSQADALLKALQLGARVTSKTAGHAVLESVRLMTEGQRVQIDATDSYRLLRTTLDDEAVDSIAADYDTLLPGSVIRYIVDAFNPSEPLKVFFTENGVISFIGGKTQFLVTPNAGKFPDLDVIFQTPIGCEALLPPDTAGEMLEAIKFINSMGDRKESRVRLSFGREEVTAAAYMKSGGGAESIVPYSIEWDGIPFHIMLNGHYLTDIIPFSNAILRVGYSSPTAVMQFAWSQAGNEIRYGVMPITDGQE